MIAFVLTKPTSVLSILFSTLNIEYYKIAILKSLGGVSRKTQNLYHKIFSKAYNNYLWLRQLYREHLVSHFLLLGNLVIQS